MIDFSLSELDQKILAEVREQALVTRNYARYYDEHEEEFVPDALPEADQYQSPYALMGQIGENDTPISIMAMLISAGTNWGDYGVRIRQ